jgi:two-component system NarL family sensor kinase
MLKTSPLILLLFFATPALSQHNGADSLLNVVKTAATPAAQLSALTELSGLLSLKNFDSNLVFGRQGLALAILQKDTSATGVMYHHIGWAHYFKGSYDTAAFYYYKAAAILEKKQAPALLAALYNDIAKLYRKTGPYNRALTFYNKAAAIYTALGDDNNLATTYNELGVVYEYQSNYNEALSNYRQALALKQKMGDSIGISYALSFIAGIYNTQKNYREAKTYNLQSLEIRQRLKDSFAIALSYSDLGDTYNAEGDYTRAAESYLQSNQYAEGIHFQDMILSNLKQLSGVAEKQGNYQASLSYFRRYNNIKDSIYRLESAKQVEELSRKYETAEKEETIQLQKFQITRRNYWIAGITGTLVLGSLLAYSAYRRYRLQQQARLNLEITRQQDLATKAVIAAEETERKRIAGDLHDGIGQMMSAAKMNLSSIEHELPFTTPEQKTRFEKVVGLIDESCNELRAVSHNMMPNALLKSGLAMAIREFLEKIDRRVIRISLHAEGLNEKIDANIETVLYRVIQECVNNVIKHAGANRLDISLLRDSDGINAVIEDNGHGFNTNDIASFEGIGIKNIQSRIAYLKGTVEWDSKPGMGTAVSIYVPFM